MAKKKKKVACIVVYSLAVVMKLPIYGEKKKKWHVFLWLPNANDYLASPGVKPTCTKKKKKKEKKRKEKKKP